MEKLKWVVFGMGYILFVVKSMNCFRKIGIYIKNKGYNDETLYYLACPFSEKRIFNRPMSHISKDLMKVIIMSVWLATIIITVYRQDVYLGIVLVIVGYLGLLIWYKAYSLARGIRLLETGFVSGVEIIKWDDIRLYQFLPKVPGQSKDREVLKIIRHKKIIPKHIEIASRHRGEVEKLLSKGR